MRTAALAYRFGAWTKTRRPWPRLIWSSLLLAVGVSAGALLSEALVRARLDPDAFSSATRFYAQPLVFRSGLTLDRAKVERTLHRLGYVKARRRAVGVGEYRLGYGDWVIGRRPVRFGGDVDPGGVIAVEVGYDGRIYEVRGRRGVRLEAAALEPELLALSGSDGKDRVPVPLSQFPQHTIDAVLAVEDRRFFEHGGLDLRRIVGAALANARAGRVVEGASTITQQLAKNLFLSSHRSLLRKAREAMIALVLEDRHTKDQILEAYLNEVYLGHVSGVALHGVGRAAQVYFGKDVTELEVAESALLAAMVRGPNLYSPARHPQLARERRDLVLSLMRDQGRIGGDAYRRAVRTRLAVQPAPDLVASGRYFVDYVTRDIAARHGRRALRPGDAVFTTLDLELQRAAERAVRDGLRWLEREVDYLARADRPLQAALVALDPATGAVLAMVGGRDYGQTQFNRATDARRQPGSAFKPVVALAALAGRQATLATLIDDEPLAVETPAGVWRPTNYDDRFRGPVTLREALERSLNVPFARLGLALGPERIVETARSLGIERRLPAVPSIAIGAAEVTPLELTRAFGVIGAGGYRAPTNAVLGIVDRDGAVRERPEVAGSYVYTPSETYLVTSALRGAVERGTGRGLRAMGYYGEVAAKSGTTNGYRDAWFVGYTPTMAIGVWVGFDDGRTIGLPGSRAALPIFGRFLASAAGRYGEGSFEVPPGLEVVEVDARSGQRGGWRCRGESELFLRGTAPEEACGGDRWVWGRSFEREWSRFRDRVIDPVLEELRRFGRR